MSETERTGKCTGISFWPLGLLKNGKAFKSCEKLFKRTLKSIILL